MEHIISEETIQKIKKHLHRNEKEKEPAPKGAGS
ncbi:MAG: hypothetical protein E7243_02000 [Lacrimispora celerecrescens]|nr:hypothetical protein [Lacrimispora celerecrescens]